MATKREKVLATALNSLIQELKAQGLSFSENMDSLQNGLSEILNEAVDSGVKTDDKFHYSGVEVLDMTPTERAKLGVLEFTVTYHNEIILRVYWSTSLEWLLQPCNDGSFEYIMKKKCPCKTAIKPFLKKLAEEELDKPGSFADKYYVIKPSRIVLKRNDDSERKEMTQFA